MTRKKVQNRGRNVKRRKKVDLGSLLAKSSINNWHVAGNYSLATPRWQLLVGNSTGHKA
ncbi:MAG: hypothetical protein WBM35_06125 [Candidatus Electrothrix sp.]